MSRPRPEAVGYYAGRRGIPVELTMLRRAAIAAFAEAEGFALGEIFVEQTALPSVAFQALLNQAAKNTIEAVIVAALDDLGADRQTRDLSQQQLQRVGVRVIVLPPELHHLERQPAWRVPSERSPSEVQIPAWTRPAPS